MNTKSILSLVFSLCLSAGARAAVPVMPSYDVSTLTYRTCVNGICSSKSEDPRVIGWWACQEWRRQAEENVEEPVYIDDYTIGPENAAQVDWRWGCHIQILQSPPHGAGFGGFLPGSREDIPTCPSTHPVGPDEQGLCYIDDALNAGPAMCGLGTNPIHAFTGNKYQKVDIVSASTTNPLYFSWHYNSLTSGQHWRHSFDLQIETNVLERLAVPASIATKTPSSLYAHVKLADGREVSFTNEMEWSTRSTVAADWSRDVPSIAYALKSMVDGTTGEVIGLELQEAAGRSWIFNLAGQLQSTTYQDRSLFMGWQADSLVSVTDEFGRGATLDYDPQNSQLSSLTPTTGEQYRFEFANDVLVKAFFPDDNADPQDDPYRQFLYEDPTFTTYLTGIIDERSNRVATWTYDTLGHAVSSEHAFGTDHYGLEFDTETTTIIDPRGVARTYGFTNEHGVIRIESAIGGDCSTCGADAQSYTYDANGFIATKTDFNNHVTSYIRDALGRETSRTEAVGTPEARTITTTWHPVFNKVETVTEPGRVTTYDYWPDGHLKSTTVQPQP